MTAAAARDQHSAWMRMRRRLARWYARINEAFRRWTDEEDRWR